MRNPGLFHIGEGAPAWLLERGDRLQGDREHVSPHTKHTKGRRVPAQVAAKKRAAAKRKRQAARKARRRHQYGTKRGNRQYRGKRA